MVSSTVLMMLLASTASVALQSPFGAQSEDDEPGSGSSTEISNDKEPPQQENVVLTEEANIYITERDGDDLKAQNIYGGDNIDLLIGGRSDDIIFGGAGEEGEIGAQERSWSFETLLGNAGNDTLYGGGGRDYLSGSSGDDVVFGGAGNDDLTDLTVSTEQIIDRVATGSQALISSFETDAEHDDDTFFGGSGDDYLSSLNGADILYGGAGQDVAFTYDRGGEHLADVFYGGAGNDNVFADHGDVLYGGAGVDLFGVTTAFNALDLDDENYVTIKDFEINVDVLRFYDEMIAANVSANFGAEAKLVAVKHHHGTMINVSSIIEGESRLHDMAFVEGVSKSEIDKLIARGDIELVLLGDRQNI